LCGDPYYDYSLSCGLPQADMDANKQGLVEYDKIKSNCKVNR